MVCTFLVTTRRCFNNDATSCDIIRRRIDVEMTSCVYGDDTFRRVVSEDFQQIVDHNGRDNKSHLLENANK